MLGFKKNQRSQDLDITNVAKLKLVEQGASTKKVKASTPKKSEKKRSVSPKTATSLPLSLDMSLETRIAQRAYEIHAERCCIGAPLQDWLRAEREVLADMELEG